MHVLSVLIASQSHLPCLLLQSQFANQYVNVRISDSRNATISWTWGFYVTKAIAKDTSPPVEFVQHARPSKDYLPGDDISMTFNEPIDCSVLAVSVRVVGVRDLEPADVLTVCQGNMVFVDFSPVLSFSVRLLLTCMLCWR